MKYLIIPDVHGRSFWRKPVLTALQEDDTKVIFLGDYLDPYPDEFKHTDYKKLAFDVFNEILELKKAFPDKIVLLQGNHDMEYSIGISICNCRRDSGRYLAIQNLFIENKALFSLCYEVKQGDDRFILSHAGIKLEALKEAKIEGFTTDNIVDFLNNQFDVMRDAEFPDEQSFAQYLEQCSYWRGGYNKHSSCIWGDVREMIYDKPEVFAYQIFGHTRSDRPIKTDWFAMLDTSAPFWLTEDGKILTYDGLEIPNLDLDDIDN